MKRAADSQTDVDSKLDMLISRIQSLGNEAADEVDRPKQQPRRASAEVPLSETPAPVGGPRPVNEPASPSPIGSPPSGPAPVGQAPVGQAPIGQAPMGQSPIGQAPAGPAPASPAPASPIAAPPLATGPATGGLASAPPPPAASIDNPAHSRAVQSLKVPLAAGFTPTRDEPWRPAEPQDPQQAGVNESIVEAIIYRFLQNAGEAEGRRIADQVRLPFRMVEPILTRLKMEQNVAYRSATETNDYIYILTESGREIARNHLVDCTYYGSCPVPLEHYIASVKYQTIEGQYPKKQDLLNAFKDLLINPRMLEKLGPAVASGRGMFLFGFPGNGKTSIAERVTGAFGKYIWIPRAVDVDGDVMRVFDPMSHNMADPESTSGLLDVGGFDKRWVRIERPTIIAGGELTMNMLEVQYNAESNISESSLQLKSNCGTLVIDDFGRQKMPVDALLNRWIVPLEKRYDFLNMASGKKIQVPFDQLVVFSTNLEPKDLVDDAFLRRIPYKIEVTDPPEPDFRKLFEIMSKILKVPYRQDSIDYLIETHYKPVNRPMRMCQPRDLLLQVKNYCLYNDIEVDMRNEYFDFACDNYFSVM